MKIQEIADRLAVPLEILPLREVHRAPDQLGYSPTGTAVLARKAGRLVVYVADQPRPVGDNVLHELCHAIVGPDSLENEDEGMLMALQWAIMTTLPPDEYTECRKAWCEYGFVDSSIGPDDDFLKTRVWVDLVDEAVAEGLLDAHGAPVLKVHSGFSGVLKT